MPPFSDLGNRGHAVGLMLAYTFSDQVPPETLFETRNIYFPGTLKTPLGEENNLYWNTRNAFDLKECKVL